MYNIDLFCFFKKYASNNLVVRINSGKQTTMFKYNIYLNKLDYSKVYEIYNEYTKIKNDNVEINVNDFPIKSVTDLEELKDLYNISEFNVQFSLNEFYLPRDNKLYFLNLESYKSFLKNFFEHVKIKDLKGITKKIYIGIFEKGNFDDADIDSCLFSTKIDDDELKTVNVYEKNIYLLENSVLIIPNIVPKVVISNDLIIEITDLIIDILCEKKLRTESNVEYVIRMGNDQYLKKDKIDYTCELIDCLYRVVYFIYGSNKYIFDKLAIFKSCLIDGMEHNSEYKFDEKELNLVLKKTEDDYSFFINDSVKKFVEDKKAATASFIDVSNQVAEKVNSKINDISKIILTTLGIVISTFFVKDYGSTERVIFICGVAFCYYLSVVIINLLKGWSFNSEHYEKQKNKIIEKYNELYGISDDFLKKEAEAIVEAELNKLKTIECLNKIINYFFLMLSLLFFICA